MAPILNDATRLHGLVQLCNAHAGDSLSQASAALVPGDVLSVQAFKLRCALVLCLQHSVLGDLAARICAYFAIADGHDWDRPTTIPFLKYLVQVCTL